VTTRTPDDVELVFPGGLSLRGVVVDANGRPVPGASVRAWREVGDDPHDRESPHGATDGDGRFAIDVTKRAHYELIASADGHANSDAVVVETTTERPHAEARLVLRPFATIRGTVRRGDGTAFAGVQVFAMLDGYGMGSSSKAGVEDRYVRGKGTTSGDDGRFTLKVDSGTPWHVVAQPHPDNRWFRFTVADVAPGRDDVIVTIRDEDLAGCIVRGDVIAAADAQPVTTFVVEVVSFGADGEPCDSTRAAAKIDGHRFELPPLPLGKVFAFDVRPTRPANAEVGAAFSHDTLAPVRVGPLTTTAAGVELHVRVEPWGELPVQILTAEGKPARDVFVLARRRPRIDTGIRGWRRADAGGRALLTKCVPGPHAIVVGVADTVRHEQEVLISPGLNPELTVRLPATR
jgi:hypothetical protein